MDFAKIFEILFNIAYLVTIWTLVGKIFTHRRSCAAEDNPIAKRFLIGFFLLALGDTGHVGFRVWAYALGGLDRKLTVGGTQIPLVGIGALCTAYTITILYMLIVDIWRLRFHKKIGPLYLLLQAVATARLIIMLFPQNQWGSVVPPYNWSLYRNMPLTFVGLAIAVLILIDAGKNKDKVFQTFSYYIFASYFFYLPVIFFLQKAPWMGMLMIPKTIAYILMAVLAYRHFFKASNSLQK